MKKAKQPNPFLLGVAWVGLAFSLYLIGAAVWYHFNFDPLLRIPFVLFCGGGGLVIGLSSIGYIITGKFS